MSFHDINRVSIKKEVEKRDTSFLHSTTLNDSILYLALVYYDVKHPKTVLAQAKLESGNYTSRLHRKNNNFLGLYNSRRGEYFKFNHWTDCIKGYKNTLFKISMPLNCLQNVQKLFVGKVILKFYHTSFVIFFTYFHILFKFWNVYLYKIFTFCLFYC